MSKRHDDSYLGLAARVIRDIPDDHKRNPCRVYVDPRGKKHPQHTPVLVFLDDEYMEYRCMYCLEYFTYRRVKPGQQKLF